MQMENIQYIPNLVGFFFGFVCVLFYLLEYICTLFAWFMSCKQNMKKFMQILLLPGINSAVWYLLVYLQHINDSDPVNDFMSCMLMTSLELYYFI